MSAEHIIIMIRKGEEMKNQQILGTFMLDGMLVRWNARNRCKTELLPEYHLGQQRRLRERN